MAETVGATVDALGCPLNITTDDMVTEALVLLKTVDMSTGQVGLVISESEGMDWIAQRGILAAAQTIIDQEQFGPADED